MTPTGLHEIAAKCERVLMPVNSYAKEAFCFLNPKGEPKDQSTVTLHTTDCERTKTT